MGRYRVTDTIRLRPDSVLIALHPSLTHVYLPDETPAFTGVGRREGADPKREGRQRDPSRVGLWTGAINRRATALLWKAGAASEVNDVKIQGGGAGRC